ncbi:hypothetical protein BsWGS_16483 [Bradybaena similaris]
MESLINTVLTLLATIVLPLTANSDCPYDVPATRLLAGHLFTSQGCSCDNKTLDCFNLLQIPKLRKCSNTTVVDKATFQAGSIDTLPINSLPANLVSISFAQNPLTNIAEDAFQTSASTLTELSFSDAAFVRLPDAFRKLPNLTTLKIENIHIRDWNQPALQTLGKTVLELHLNKVGLKSWPSWLRSFTCLKTLDLSENDLGYLPDDAFTSLEASLTNLYLSLAGLTQLPNSLSTLQTLNLLDLSRNLLSANNDRPAVERIATMPFGTKLSTLVVNLMNLAVVPDIAHLTNLSVIDLSYNHIASLSSGHLPATILEIRLSYNKLTEITDSNVNSYPKLTSLWLDNNPKLTITPSAFVALAGLKYLDISSTHLDSFPQGMTAMINEQTLQMSKNPLRCSCPQNQELFHWFASFRGRISGNCADGRDVTAYLRGACQTTASTTATTTTHREAGLGDVDTASAADCSLFCRFACFFLLFFVYIYID